VDLKEQEWLETFHGRDLDGHSSLLVVDELVLDESTECRAENVSTLYYVKRNGALSCNRFGLILPTSLCSSQVCSGIVHQLNDQLLVQRGSGGGDVTRYLALKHSEGKKVRLIYFFFFFFFYYL
jgi:hypothetical protein